jgi:twitching motility protein PilT
MDVSFELDGRYRANCFTAMGKRCAAIRIIKDDILPLSSLGLPTDLVERIQKKKGLSLIVGKTGAGKSTTLAALTKGLLDAENAHIISLEDPVEYKIIGDRGEITQRELGIDFGSFDQGITEALRQSPDYLIIGEIRSLSALKAAISASEAGHGILGTLHSVGAARTLSRMLSMFSLHEKEFVRFQLAQNLNFILSQKLNHEVNKTELDFELLLNLPSVENTIREGRFNQLDNLILLGERQGMRMFKST